MLRLTNVNAYYGDSHILHGIDLTIEPRARVALIGRNGAGKSTVLKSIMNAGPRVEGRVEWEGRDLEHVPDFKRARVGLHLVPEDRRILPNLTVLENLEIVARARPKGAAVRAPAEVLRKFPLLSELGNRPGGHMSGGQQQALAIARALVACPKLMLLDEPTEGLAPAIVQRLVNDVVSICEDGETALLLCEQNLWFAHQCTDRVHVIEGGKIVFEGDWQTFKAGDAKERYLTV